MAKRLDTQSAASAGMRLLRAVLVGLLAATLVLGGAFALLPAQTAHDPARLYDYVYSGTKSKSTAFTLAAMSDDGYLAFGSSEFYISKDKVAQSPQVVFGENVTVLISPTSARRTTRACGRPSPPVRMATR